MTHVCAKPACAELVEVWLDFAPVSQTVHERANRTDVSVGLCPQHAARFTVPSGWAFERLDGHGRQEQIHVGSSRQPDSADEVPKRRHHRGRPWFLALPEEPSTASAQRAERAATIAADTHSEALLDADADAEPTAGSLLHRAFHGPDRDADMARAIQLHQDELETRRSARTPADRATSNGHGMAELPFPPFESEPRAAVS